MPRSVKSIFRKVAYFISILAISFIVLAFTDIPYKAYHHLSSPEEKLETSPKYIVIMGGDGMPSPQGLMRLYYGIDKAKRFQKSKIIIAHPYNLKDSTEQLDLMKKEFIYKSIDSNRIIYAAKGFNTRTQAMEISEMIPNKKLAILIITSPQHTFRAIASFKKVGFKNIGGSPTFERPPDKELLDKNLDEEHRIHKLNLRYNVWSYMQYEIIVLREYAAIAYYWFKGWI